MKIYKSNGAILIDVPVDDNSYRYKAIMGDNTLTLYYSLAEHVEIPVGAYCMYQGETYTLMRPSNFKMQHSRDFEYTVTMQSEQAKAKIWKFRNTVDCRLQFPLTAKPVEHLQMFVDNMNRRDSGWTVGDCVDGEEQLISYDHAYCLEALAQMADTFKTEYEIVGKVVSLKKIEYNKSTPLPLSYGKGHGFKSGVGRENTSEQPPVEILYVQGGSDNIDMSKYGNNVLLLPKNATIAYDGEHFEDETGFVAANARNYITDAQGLSLRRSDKTPTSYAEDSLDASSVYPKRIGTVSSVVVVDANKHLYDFCDSSIPATLNYEDCLIAGETMTVIFQSGMLAGKEFDVKYIHNAQAGRQARRFEIVPQEIDGVMMPDSTFAPVQGDKYVVYHCQLPQSYINAYTEQSPVKEGAEWDMFRKAVQYFFDNEEQAFSFSGALDGIWAKQDWQNIGERIKLGCYILFSDARFQQTGVLVRVTGVKDYINNPHSPEIELSNKTVSAGFSTRMAELSSQEVLIDDAKTQSMQFTKRRFRDAQETMEMLEQSLLDNFTNSINPITVRTMQLLAGDESLQYRFVTSLSDLTPVAADIVYNNATKQLVCGAAYIQHMTLGIDTISAQHSASEYKLWQVAAYTSVHLEDATKKYYLYIKASQSDNTAIYVLTETPHAMESETGYYYLLVGVLNSEYDEERSFASLYGYTEVLPARVTTDKVVSTDGNSYLDLAGGTMKLGSKLWYNGTNLYLDFLLAQNANLAGWIFRNNKLESEATNQAGNPMAFLDGKTGEIRVKGTVQFSAGVSGRLSDVNLFYLPAISSSKSLSMGAKDNDIGKVVRLYNSSAFGGGVYSIYGCTFSIKDDLSITSATFPAEIRPQECIEMTCFRRAADDPDGTEHGEWVVTGRFGQQQFRYQTQDGRYPLMLAMGVIHGRASSVYVDGYYYDGRYNSDIFTVTKVNAGRYRLSFASGTLPTGYHVFLTGGASTGSNSPVCAVVNESSTQFDILAYPEGWYQGGNLQDSDVHFMILSSEWWFNLRN